MKRSEYLRERKVLERNVRAARQSVVSGATLEEKIAAKRAVKDAEEALREHKLGYYERVDVEDV